jgi:A/G-specific adenine glycosylase
MKLTINQIKEFQHTILSYFDEFGRVFPWRETNDPYKILCSELMLQQTQTERVVPKYISWIKRFPTAQDLAIANPTEVLTQWSGLGYNRRARFLQNACKTVVNDFQGEFPHTKNELQKLSGVGPYTSGAVSAFAFNNPEVFIETNIRALYIFFFYPKTLAVSDTDLLLLIEQTLYRENPRKWYYALMDYGAELKRKVKNPNRKSAHYTKQAKFEGSLRQARGAILRQLTSQNLQVFKNTTQACLTLSEIAKAESIDYERIKKASESLKKEGFICAEGDTVYLDN